MVLAAFSRAMGQESHVLKREPDVLWQQLHNRLQWHEGPVAVLAGAERERRSGPGANPWARTRTRFRESEALLRTLTGHTDDVNACALSPDGAFVVSTRRDCTLKVWDAATGVEALSVLLLGALRCVAMHPRQLLAACGDEGGGFYVVELVGIEYSAIVVTAVDRGDGLTIRCPACQHELAIQCSGLGSEIACPQPGCGTRLKVNPYHIEMGGPSSETATPQPRHHNLGHGQHHVKQIQAATGAHDPPAATSAELLRDTSSEGGPPADDQPKKENRLSRVWRKR